VKIHCLVGSIFWLMIGISTAIHAYQLGFGHFRNPGPGFIFFLASLILIIFSAIDLALTFVRQSRIGNDGNGYGIWSTVHWRKVLLALGGLSVYAYLLNVMGFLLSTFLLMVLLFKGIEPTKWWVAITSSIIATTSSYAIFTLMKVALPTGWLGF
jgi:putative tricarboxylic transport membrane protein